MYWGNAVGPVGGLRADGGSGRAKPEARGISRASINKPPPVPCHHASRAGTIDHPKGATSPLRSSSRGQSSDSLPAKTHRYLGPVTFSAIGSR